MQELTKSQDPLQNLKISAVAKNEPKKVREIKNIIKMRQKIDHTDEEM